MQQYAALKAQNEGFLLFYRMGDFYELFAEDAEVAHGVLGITLTRRRTSKDGDAGIPMCGVPFHAAEGYIAKLLKAGHKVALCEQTETPKQAKARAGAKALVAREVTRLFTGGTVLEDHLLDAGAHQLLAVYAADTALQQGALAWSDISTGELWVEQVSPAQLATAVQRIGPQELVVSEKVADAVGMALNGRHQLTVQDGVYSRMSAAQELLERSYNVVKLIPFGLTEDTQVQAVAALWRYVELTQMGRAPKLQRPQLISRGAYVQIDARTRQHLELTHTQTGSFKGSLWHAVDATVTAAGRRLLGDWLCLPLMDVATLNSRQALVQQAATQTTATQTLRTQLAQTLDIARAIGRLSLGRGGPRDLGALRQTLLALPEIQTTVQELENTDTELFVQRLQQAAQQVAPVIAELSDALVATDELPLLARDGDFIATGYDADLDKQRELQQNGTRLLQALEHREADRTGVPMKLKYNKVWGWFFEVTKTHANKLPPEFIHKQTTANAQRFTTTGLAELERELNSSTAGAQARELELFDALCTAVTAASSELQNLAQQLAQLDVLVAAGTLLQQSDWVLPQLNEGTDFTITDGKHPVVARTVDKFMANSCALSGGQFWLVTGPNMAGKSTFLRQQALITVLAQIGYPVPAKAATIGVVDQIFTRLGASDNLAAGESTFMTEMLETAHILHHATNKSLVLLDEIGRGTATWDGLSIAWACLEHVLEQVNCRGMFATHYHELTQLADQHNALHNVHVAVKEWQDDIVFLHQVKQGAAPGSYGVHVGRLAGLPASVVQRAQDLLTEFENETGDMGKRAPKPLPLFQVAPTAEPSVVEAEIKTLDLDALSPRDAWQKLADLQKTTG